MLQFDLEDEKKTIRSFRERVRQCENSAESATGEQIRGILIDEQDHQVALATALGKSVLQSWHPRQCQQLPSSLAIHSTLLVQFRSDLWCMLTRRRSPRRSPRRIALALSNPAMLPSLTMDQIIDFN